MQTQGVVWIQTAQIIGQNYDSNAQTENAFKDKI